MSDAQIYLQELQSSDDFSDRIIITELKPYTEFTDAEDHHKDYCAINTGKPYCQIVISPKLSELRAKHREKMK